MNETRLISVLAVLFPAFFPREPFLGPRRYRVVRMRPSVSSADLTRVELQIVQAATGLPDLLLIPIWSGLAGARSELTPGALVLVQFVDGERDGAFISHMSTPDDPAWRPVNTIIDASGTVKIGASASSVELSSGNDTPLDSTGRYVRYGDPIIFATPGPGVIACTPSSPVSKVKSG